MHLGAVRAARDINFATSSTASSIFSLTFSFYILLCLTGSLKKRYFLSGNGLFLSAKIKNIFPFVFNSLIKFNNYWLFYKK